MSQNTEDAPLSPERMLALLEDQQRTVTGRMAAFVPWIVVSWGIAWTAGFLVLWVDAIRRDGAPIPSLPAGLTFAALLFAAGVVSTVLGIRSGRGVRTTRESAVAGIVYGNMWWVGSIAVVFIGQSLLRAGIGTEVLAILYPALFIFYSGVMYVMAGLIWNALPMIVLGVWSVVISAAGAFVPLPGHYLLYAIAGGGAFLVVAGWSAWWVRAARRRVSRTAGGSDG